MRSYSAGGGESALAKRLVADMQALGLNARLQEEESGRLSNMKASCAAFFGAARDRRPTNMPACGA